MFQTTSKACAIYQVYIYISLSLSLSLSPSPSPLVRLTSGPEASSAATQQMGKPKGLWIQDHLIVYILEAAIHAQASHASLMHWSVQFFCVLNFQVTFAACNLVCRNINCWSLLSVTMSGSVGLDGPGVSRSIPSVFVITLYKPRGPPCLASLCSTWAIRWLILSECASNAFSCPTRPLTASETATEHVWWTAATKGAERSVLNEAIWEAVLGVEGLIKDGVAERMVSLLFEVKRHKAFVRCSFTTGSCIFAACRRAKPTHEICKFPNFCTCHCKEKYTSRDREMKRIAQWLMGLATKRREPKWLEPKWQ